MLEIWPPGHSSPVHSHGNVFGVTRMLYGTLACESSEMPGLIVHAGLDACPGKHVVCFEGQRAACCSSCSLCLPWHSHWLHAVHVLSCSILYVSLRACSSMC